MSYDVAFWDRYFTYYDAINLSPPYCDLQDRVAELCAPRPGDLVLDAGTGTGNILGRLAARSARLVALDANVVGLRRSRTKVDAGSFLLASLERELPFADAKFDRVVCVNVIGTLSDPGRVTCLAEFRRVLKPGGRLVLSTPKRGTSLLTIYAATIRRRVTEDGFVSAPGRIARFLFPSLKLLYMTRRMSVTRYHFYEREELVADVAKAGFRIDGVDLSYADQALVLKAERPAADPS